MDLFGKVTDNQKMVRINGLTRRIGEMQARGRVGVRRSTVSMGDRHRVRCVCTQIRHLTTFSQFTHLTCRIVLITSVVLQALPFAVLISLIFTGFIFRVLFGLISRYECLFTNLNSHG